MSGKKNVLSIASATKVVVAGTSNLKTGDKPKITKGRGNSVEKK